MFCPAGLQTLDDIIISNIQFDRFIILSSQYYYMKSTKVYVITWFQDLGPATQKMPKLSCCSYLTHIRMGNALGANEELAQVWRDMIYF